jgi:glycosyltransferase involved in cell wall biosynthesis
MRILFVSHSAGLYGAERALLELVKGLKSRGVECLVTIPRPGGLFYALRDADIPVVIVPYSWWVDRPRDFWKRPGRWLLSLVGLPWLVKLTARWRPDIVYTNTLAVWIGAVAAWIGGLPHIWHVHEFVEEDLVFHLGRLLSLKLVDVLSEKVIANSETVAQRLKKYIRDTKIEVVYCSVEIPYQDEVNVSLSFANSWALTCILVGRLEEGKGQIEAIRAIGELIKDGLSVGLIIVGDGDKNYKHRIQNLIHEQKLESYVKLVGYVPEPFNLIRSADVVLVCSRNETFGRVTVEAMKLGKPVIGAASGGTVELIRDGFNGLLYSSGNYKELAEKIRLLTLQPGMLALLGKNAKEFADSNFTDETYAGKIFKIAIRLSEITSEIKQCRKHDI